VSPEVESEVLPTKGRNARLPKARVFESQTNTPLLSREL
jgi:hypothetical protein